MKNLESAAVDPLAVSVERAAGLVGVGRTTLYQAMGDGSLRFIKIGKRRLIPVEALRAWIAAHATESVRSVA